MRPLTPALVIRPMQASDLEQVKAIDRLSFSLPWPDSAFEFELFENNSSMLWVAEMSPPGEISRIIGVIVIWFILDEAHIATIAVHPDERGQGAAQELMATALIAVVQRGMLQATLEVRASNIIAQKLYRHFGFEIVGRRIRYYQDNNEDALIMTLSRLDQEYLSWLETGAWKHAALVEGENS